MKLTDYFCSAVILLTDRKHINKQQRLHNLLQKVGGGNNDIQSGHSDPRFGDSYERSNDAELESTIDDSEIKFVH